jgi:N-methylhydantoinase B
MKALIAALTICERRMGQLVQRHGFRHVAEGIEGLLDYGEERAREVLGGVPDGTYTFSDYVEVDYVTPYYIRIKVSLTVSGSNITLDFNGTDPQVRAALNLPSFGRPNQWIVLGIVNFLRTSDRHLPLNRGILRSVTVKIPEGSLLNPSPVAASGVRHTTGYRVADAVLGALSQAVPRSIPAAGAGQVAIVLFSHLAPATGAYKVSVLQPMQGGCGGRPTKDGIDGVNFSAGSLRNIPTESIELEAPVFVHRYMLTDRVAPGEYRGGAGVIFEFRCLAPDAIVTARGMDRFKLRPYGRKGGGPGTLGRTLLNPGSATENQIGKIDILKLQPGDVVQIVAPGGGGYGDPILRDPARVLKDVEDGFVSASEAIELYGVAIEDGKVNAAQTSEIRTRLGQSRQNEEFVFGEERLTYERTFPLELQDLVARLLASRPGAVRQYARDRLYAAIEDGALISQPPQSTEQKLRDMLDRLLSGGQAEAAE